LLVLVELYNFDSSSRETAQWQTSIVRVWPSSQNGLFALLG
jgi:hypothetical protein